MTLEETLEYAKEDLRVCRSKLPAYPSPGEKRHLLAKESAIQHLEAGKAALLEAQMDTVRIAKLEIATVPDHQHDVMHLPGLSWAPTLRDAIDAMPFPQPSQKDQP